MRDMGELCTVGVGLQASDPLLQREPSGGSVPIRPGDRLHFGPGASEQRRPGRHLRGLKDTAAALVVEQTFAKPPSRGIAGTSASHFGVANELRRRV